MAYRNRRCHSQRSTSRVDRISGLHLSVLHQILSFLPSIYAVRTSVLSKSWRNVWCSMPSLELNDKTFERSDGEEKFCEFVDILLHHRDGSLIQRFCLRMPDMPFHMRKVDAWIIYALRHNVEVINIEYLEYGGDGPGPHYDMEFTPLLFNSASLTELLICLRGKDQGLDLPTSICLPALRVLHLMNVTVNYVELNEALFLSSLPSLETLILQVCSLKHHKLSTISARKLKKLTMTGLLPASLEIDSPNLISLELSSIPDCFSSPDLHEHHTIIFKSNPIHLVDANIDVDSSWFESMGHLFAALKNTLSLTLSSRFLEASISRFQEDVSLLKCECPSLPSIRRLEVATSFSDGEMLFINTILSHSPRIRTLTVDVNWEAPSHVHTEAEKNWSKCELAHLKSVQIKGYEASENQVRFVKHLLENARFLENLAFPKGGERW